MNILLIMSLILFWLALILLLINYLLKNNNHLKLVPYKHHDYFSIVIPARYESVVLEGLLISIESQSLKVNPQDVYIILEREDIKSIEIVKRHNMSIIYRTNLTLERKGYALNEAFQTIYKKNYDAYFIIDADNILDSDFIKSMSKTLSLGYDIGVGYRAPKNPNDSLTSAASSLTFSLINTLNNKSRIKHHKTITISGTGFYIKGTVIKELKGYPFTTLTEDYELSLYATVNGLNTYYNEEAIFYDEQPVNYNESITQRTRWVKGYFMARRKYLFQIKDKLFHHPDNINSLITEYIGVRPYIYLIISLLLYIIANLSSFIYIILALLILYLVLYLLTLLMLIKENGRLKLDRNMSLKVLLFNPIFLISYIRCALIALLTPNLEWQKIDHIKNNIE